MKFQKIIFCGFILFILVSCTQKEEKVSLIKENNLEKQMTEAYNEGLKELKKGDIFLQQKNLTKLNFYTLNLFGHQDQP